MCRQKAGTVRRRRRGEKDDMRAGWAGQGLDGLQEGRMAQKPLYGGELGLMLSDRICPETALAIRSSLFIVA